MTSSTLDYENPVRVFRKVVPAGYSDDWDLAIWELYYGRVTTYNQLGNMMNSSDVTEQYMYNWYRHAGSTVEEITDVWVDRGL